MNVQSGIPQTCPMCAALVAPGDSARVRHAEFHASIGELAAKIDQVRELLQSAAARTQREQRANLRPA